MNKKYIVVGLIIFILISSCCCFKSEQSQILSISIFIDGEQNFLNKSIIMENYSTNCYDDCKINLSIKIKEKNKEIFTNSINNLSKVIFDTKDVILLTSPKTGDSYTLIIEFFIKQINNNLSDNLNGTSNILLEKIKVINQDEIKCSLQNNSSEFDNYLKIERVNKQNSIIKIDNLWIKISANVALV